MPDPLSLISAHKRDVSAEIDHLAKRLTALRTELDELAIAERVLIKLRAGPEHEDPSTNASVIIEKSEQGKPVGLLTVPEMIIKALGSAKTSGLRGLAPKTITLRISESGWPDIQNETVNSIAWRMWKRGQLQKEGALYILPQKNEAASLPSKSGPAASKSAPS